VKRFAVDGERVGDIYPARGSGPGGLRCGTRYFLVLAVTKRVPHSRHTQVHSLGLDKDWRALSTSSYGGGVLYERGVVVRVKDLGSFVERACRGA